MRSRRQRMRRREFEELVLQALEGLPPDIRRLIDNVEIVVEREPTVEQLEAAGIDPDSDETLFGLYEGVPLTERGVDYGLVLPDRITIFQGPLEELCASREEIMHEVRTTVVHELAHHFGISDERLRELGYE
jgi:predicted Zn-dependent protease with MMP-like domain